MHLGKMLTIFLLFIDPSYHKRGSKFDIACGTLKDAVHYFKRYYQKFNIDGFGGAARAEAILAYLHKNARMPTPVSKVVDSSLRQLDNIIRVAVPKLPTPEEKYAIFSRYLLDPSRWYGPIDFKSGELRARVLKDIAQIPRNKPSVYLDYLYSSTFDEQHSDACIVELIKSSQRDSRCPISLNCTDYMVTHKYMDPAYGVTHRLLFLQIAKAMRCRWEETWVQNKIKDYCAYILEEARTNEQFGYLKGFDDLLIEQIILCGAEGFEEFLNRRWFNEIITKQSIEGCFGNEVPAKMHKIHKRESNDLGNGCSDHTTGLALNYLALYLRYLVRDHIHDQHIMRHLV